MAQGRVLAMNRRQFLGASLAGIIAALSLPFERFAEWCKAWLPKRDAYEYRLMSYPVFSLRSPAAQFQLVADLLDEGLIGGDTAEALLT